MPRTWRRKRKQPDPDPKPPQEAAAGASRAPAGWAAFTSRLMRPVDGGSLGIFRIAVGLVMLLEAIALFQPSQSTAGRVMLDTYYTGSGITFSFPYPGLEWLPLLPPLWIRAAVVFLGAASLALALGWWSRLSALLVFLCWGYLYAVECTRTYWMSYYYLELLVTFLLIWLPAGSRYSLDARRATPGGTTSQVPFWTVFLLRSQLVLTYFYAGVAKCTADWVLDAQPVRYYLDHAAILKRLANLLSPESLSRMHAFLLSEGVVRVISLGGLVFDLIVGPLLLFPRTRLLGLVWLVLFHTTNSLVIFDDIIWFPLLGILTASIFLNPDWPSRLGRWLAHPSIPCPDRRWLVAGALLIPVLGATLGWSAARNPATASHIPPRRNPLAIGLVLGWLALQAILPLRAWLIPGDARVTFEGLSFSWRLKAEVYRTQPCSLTIVDPAILSPGTNTPPTIHWDRWPAEKVLYREASAPQLDWSQLPELLVVAEPVLGERVIYNPFAGYPAGRSEAECRARASQLWQEIHGRLPRRMQRTATLRELAVALSRATASRGQPTSPEVAESLLLERFAGSVAPEDLLLLMRQIHPLALEGLPPPPVPFLTLNDPALEADPPRPDGAIDRSAWKPAPPAAFASPGEPRHEGAQPLIVLTAPSLWRQLVSGQKTCLADSMNDTPAAPRIAWGYLSELPTSKAMHVSFQPFLLRRYARRVADQWQHQFGRRPAVLARAYLSLNLRPYQLVVDPQTDLASVPLRWFSHNPWILDLATPRIPPPPAVPEDPPTAPARSPHSLPTPG